MSFGGAYDGFVVSLNSFRGLTCVCYLQGLQIYKHRILGVPATKAVCASYEAELLPAQNLTRSRYLPSFTFQDPIVKVSSLEAFALNLRLLRTVFDVDFELHSCRVAGPTEIVTRCALGFSCQQPNACQL